MNGMGNVYLAALDTYGKLTIGDSDIDGVGVCSVDDALPCAVVSVEVGLLDENVAILLVCVAQESHFVIKLAVALIVSAGFFQLCVWDLKFSMMFEKCSYARAL